MERAWEFYEGSDGSTPVKKELAKCQLSTPESAKLRTLMQRVVDRQTLPGDVKNLGKGMLEVRLSGHQRIFRLLYAEEEGGLVLLGLAFFQKKSQQTPSNDLNAARKRLADWQERRAKE
ncbi:type II toxin-antitoxin system RelE/ParE family toxin [Kitasatospora sp. NPDC003701]